MRSITARLALFLTAFACAGDDPRTRTFENTGDVFLSPRDGGGTNVLVPIDSCGSSCNDVDASCNANLVNGAILVRSQAVATSPSAGTVCNTACYAVSTTCVLPELPDGTYQLHHGTGSGSVTLPVSTRTQVTGNPYPSPPP